MNQQEWQLPEGEDKYCWRRLGPKNVPEMGNLIRRIEDFDNPPFRTAVCEIEAFFSAPTKWRTIGAFGADNNLVAYAQVRPRLLVNEVVCDGGVDPRYRGQGLGRAAITWQRDQASILLDASRPGRILFYVEDVSPDLSSLLLDAGYQETDSFVDVCRDLTNPIKSAPVPYPFEVVPWDEELDEMLRHALNRVIALKIGLPGGLLLLPIVLLWRLIRLLTVPRLPDSRFLLFIAKIGRRLGIVKDILICWVCYRAGKMRQFCGL